jgi:hypothetical protein
VNTEYPIYLSGEHRADTFPTYECERGHRTSGGIITFVIPGEENVDLCLQCLRDQLLAIGVKRAVKVSAAAEEAHMQGTAE